MNDFQTTTVQALAINSAKKNWDLLFTNLEDRAVLYKDFDKKSNRIANGIKALGLGANDRISVILPNGLEYALADFGIYKSGAALVPSNMMVAEGDIAHILQDASVKMAFVHESMAEKVLAMQKNLPLLKQIVVVGGASRDGLTGWEDFLAQNSEEPLTPTASEADDALIVYTGGTTGKPKGVLHSQRGLFFDVIAHVVGLPLTHKDKILLMTPMSHATGWLLFAGCVKGTSFCFEMVFDPFKVLEVIEKEKVTMTMMVPTIIYVFLDILKGMEVDTSSLRIIGYGAAPIAASRLEEAMERFGRIFYQKYGLVECPNMITTLTVEDHVRALEKPSILQSCGKPDHMVSLKIIDDDGNELPIGQVGEIVVKAPYVMSGYLNLEETTQETLKDGWLYTGDMGKVDDEGYVYIVDRKKDLVITGGMNVFPADVEACLINHPQVKEVSVIGIPDDHWGEMVTACVVAEEGAVEEELIQFCKGKVSKYAVPKKVIFVKELPKTIIGKIDKKALRAPFWEEKLRQVN
ncbi:fatty-acyl-CoA synthase [Desulfatibacillum alkenivorans DSM 16219]|jgi:fatty-acyl-CoA synthase/long-chain acyl-CoA synthetase|uniref:Fatty-acyl-CoA synthase n=1 Tax=Desulfatibacillum alkenivorans DSM 16219 TaxID=1121393 RepID=A0A1M6SIG3_9BACT|nr:AMP-binding protein [Desulfatibacillum alkenivorans]SHK44495.1 fatty-acyl-CoA synthase [Desulfatibacillum alkenivorans DSM 16219]